MAQEAGAQRVFDLTDALMRTVTGSGKIALTPQVPAI